MALHCGQFFENTMGYEHDYKQNAPWLLGETCDCLISGRIRCFPTSGMSHGFPASGRRDSFAFGRDVLFSAASISLRMSACREIFAVIV